MLEKTKKKNEKIKQFGKFSDEKRDKGNEMYWAYRINNNIQYDGDFGGRRSRAWRA